MEALGIVTATKNPRWHRVVASGPSAFSNAMVEAGELEPGDEVIVTIEKRQPTTTEEA